MASAILELEDIELDCGGPQVLRVVEGLTVTITLHGPRNNKVERITKRPDMHAQTGGTVCSTAHYYGECDSYEWPAEVGEEGTVTLVASAFRTDDPNRSVRTETWKITLANGRATAFERA